MTKEIKVGSLDTPVAPADKLIDTVQSANTDNRKAKSTNRTVQRPSQHELKSKHRTVLIKQKTDDYLKMLATIYGTSVNELVNQALDKFVAEQLQDKKISSKLKLLQEITNNK